MKKILIIISVLMFFSLCSCEKEISNNLIESKTTTTEESSSIKEETTTEFIVASTTVEDTTTVAETTTEESTTKSSKTKTTENNTSKKPKITTTNTTKKDVSPTYVKGVLIVNKTYALPKSYAPGVNQTALNAYYEMKNDAAKEGVNFEIISSYRPYSSQERIYNNYVARDGKAEADRYSARPGHSEHQTGLAFDLNSLSQSFENTAEGKWLAENCYKYGFVIRYPKGKESITGYMYEPWHIRYLGKDLAKQVYESGLTLEEFLGISSRYSD